MYSAGQIQQEVQDILEKPVILSTGSTYWQCKPGETPKQLPRKTKLTLPPQDYVYLERNSSSHYKFATFYMCERPDQNAVDVYVFCGWMNNIKDYLKPTLKEILACMHQIYACGIRYFKNEHYTTMLYMDFRNYPNLEFYNPASHQYTGTIQDEKELKQLKKPSSASAWFWSCPDLRKQLASCDTTYGKWYKLPGDLNLNHPDTVKIIEELAKEPQLFAYRNKFPWSTFATQDLVTGKFDGSDILDVINLLLTKPYTKKCNLGESDSFAEATNIIKNWQPSDPTTYVNEKFALYTDGFWGGIFDIAGRHIAKYDSVNSKWIPTQIDDMLWGLHDWQKKKDFINAIAQQIEQIDPEWKKILDEDRTINSTVINAWLSWPKWAKAHKVDKYIPEFQTFWQKQYLGHPNRLAKRIDAYNKILPLATPEMQMALQVCAEEDLYLKPDAILDYYPEGTTFEEVMKTFVHNPLELAGVIRLCGYGSAGNGDIDRYLTELCNVTPRHTVEDTTYNLIRLSNREIGMGDIEPRLRLEDSYKQLPKMVELPYVYNKQQQVVTLKLYRDKANWMLPIGTWYVTHYIKEAEQQLDFEAQHKKLQDRFHWATVEFKTLDINTEECIISCENNGYFYKLVAEMNENLATFQTQGLLQHIR